MHPSHRRTLESSPIAPLLLAAALFGLAVDARAVTPMPPQDDAPSARSSWVEVLARLGSDERVAELELLRRTEGTAALLAQLAQDKDTLQRAAATEIEASGLTPNSSRYKSIQKQLSATLEMLATIELAVTATKDASGQDAAQASPSGESDRAEIRTIVGGALATGNMNLLNQFGGAIEDQLAEHALAATHPAALLRTRTRVLAALADIAPERAVDVALELSGRPGRGWAAAVGQSLQTLSQQSGVPNTVNVPVGMPESKSFELALRLLASDEVAVDIRVALALPFLAAGIDDPRLLAASEPLAPEMRGHRTFTSSKLEWWHDRLLTNESREVRRAAVQARLNYDAGDLALLERLSQDADPYNRVAVASSLPGALPAKAPISPEYRALWTRALADPDAKVRRTATEALVYRASMGTFPLTAKATMELVLALDDPTDATARAELLDEVLSVIRALPTVGASNEELGQVYAALLESRVPGVTSSVLEALKHAHHEVSLAVLTTLGAPSPEVSENLASVLKGFSKLSQASAEACLRAFAHLLQRPQPPAPLVEATREALRVKSTSHSLDSLPPADAAEVLLRSAMAAPELVAGFLFRSNWERCEQALSAAASDSARSLTERSLALIALQRARPLSPETATAMAESISAMFRDSTERESAAALMIWASSVLDSEPKALSTFLVALLARPEVPTAAFGRFHLSKAQVESLSLDELSTLFDALEQRAVAAPSSDWTPFPSLAEAALDAMQREPRLVRTALVSRWSKIQSLIASATAIALQSSDSDLTAAIRAQILLQLADSDGRAALTNWIAPLIYLEGPTAAADVVAERAATLGKPELVTIATELLESSAKLREVGARLATSGTGVSRDAAITEVVALLDAPDEAVRVEAIRGLATLGAVEHLPRLIRIVGKGTPAERTAARAALDSLHQRAAREPQQAAPVQSPPAQSGDQPRDGEAPR
jgi:hypothetical protein